MKLVLYSGGQSPGNHRLHRKVVELACENRSGKNRRPLSMVYIPFCTENSRMYFQRAVRRYSSFGVKKFQCLNVDQAPTRSEIREAFASDIVYLAGGNTFYYLKNLKKSGMLPRLRAFAEKGGVLAGLSAGALVLTPHIAIAGDPNLDPDENEVRLRDLRALGLVNFEFAPHFQSSSKMIQGLLNYSRKSRWPIFACPDGSGLVVQGREIATCGKVSVFYQGTRFKLA